MKNNSCPKCGNKESSTSKVRMTGGGLSRFMDIQSQAFDAVSCEECGYTEFYSKESDRKSDVLDFLIGG